jgi:hypothetical protein
MLMGSLSCAVWVTVVVLGSDVCVTVVGVRAMSMRPLLFASGVCVSSYEGVIDSSVTTRMVVSEFWVAVVVVRGRRRVRDRGTSGERLPCGRCCYGGHRPMRDRWNDVERLLCGRCC